MKKLLLAALALAAHPAQAQKPAPRPDQGAYFQQEVNYSIDVKLDDRRHELRGHEDLTYVNNSGKPLAFIWFHLWPNAYHDNSTAFGRQQLVQGKRRFQFAKAADRGFIDSLNFVVDGQPATLEYDAYNPDVAKLLLPAPLAAGASARISTPFRVKIPASFSRFGHVGQSYQITQWYPKPAVLDRRGWHQMPYLDQGEFYSEFGAFDVSITLPANYTVGATGELQNPDEQARLAALAQADDAKKTTADFGKDLAFPASAPTTKTLRYRQDKIHDFAWFADKRFHVRQSAVTLPSGRKVATTVLFTNKSAEKWLKGLQGVNDAITYYSKWVGEYPYSAATAVDGALSAGGGMEYPMVTVTLPEAIVHEVGHNWFYGILGSNERDFPWLDEGLNSLLENRVGELTDRHYGMLSEPAKHPRFARAFGIDSLPNAGLAQLPYQALASRGLDQPVQGPTSVAYTTTNYGVTVYGKTASLFRYLAGYLGQEKFDDAMRLYYTRWQFRHPYPEDMQAVFEETTGQRLGWFFQQMLTGTTRYDADLSAVAVFPDVVKVLVRTDALVPWAVPVSSVDAQGRILETQWTPAFGNTEPDPEEEATSQLNFRRPGVVALVVDAGYLTPELNRQNDVLRLDKATVALPKKGKKAQAATPAPDPTAGLGRLRTPLLLRPLLSVERWDRRTLNYVPVLGANTSDKFMLGAAFYGNVLAPRRLSYLAMPMYSFSRNELNGIGTLSLNALPEHISRTLTIAATVQRFERYLKIEPSVSFTLPHTPGHGPTHRLTLANTNVELQDFDGRTHNIQSLEYAGGGGNALHGWNAHVEFNRFTSTTISPSAAQPLLLRAEATYHRYYAAKHQVKVRLFGGRFLQNSSNDEFFLGLSGSPDYRRQAVFLDRQQISPTFAAQIHQTDERDGAFRAFLPVASQKWLSTLNIQADLPVTKLAVFADFGLTADNVLLPGADRRAQNSFYDAGLLLPLGGILTFYLPVAGSQYASGLPASRQDFTDNIRFSLRLDKLSPFRLLDGQLGR